MNRDACWDRLVGADHAVFGTVHSSRGVDAVPVVFVVVGEAIVIPIDTVKPKSTTSLQRLTNIGADPRVVLVADYFDPVDWTRLWWVRANGTAVEAPPTDAQLAALAAKYPQYADPSAIWSVIVVSVSEVAGWSAAASDDGC